ncbi:MAG: YggT family protein [Clostridia bacterium]|nr:YggT family protein [Clostridia bacterium]
MSLSALVFSTVQLFFWVLVWAIIIRALLSWFQVRAAWYWDLMRLLDAITEPVVAPIRARLPFVGGIDFSPLVAIILLRFAESIILQLLGYLFTYL